MIELCRGNSRFHPIRHDPPITAWICTFSHQQSLSIQEKLWKLLPKDELADSVEYLGPARGFRGKNTSVKFANGSVILLKTTMAGPHAVASGTVHAVLVDEPTTEPVYRELRARLRRTRGVLGFTATPINSDCRWLEDEVKAGKINYHRHDLSVENVTPLGDTRPLPCEDGTPMDQAYIDQLVEETPAAIADTALHGHFRSQLIGAWLDCFISDPSIPGSHVSTFLPEGVPLRVHVAIDHGDKPGKQHAVLAYIEETEHGPRVYVVDEYTDETGLAIPEDDARGILAMLARHNLHWRDVDFAIGDRTHLPGSGRQKSNRDLMAHVAKALGTPRAALRPEIKTAKRGWDRVSVQPSARWLYEAMVRGSFFIHPRCERTIEGITIWTGPGHGDNPGKDQVDTLRYLTSPWWTKGVRPAMPTVKVV